MLAVIKIALGVEIWAFELSSAIWKGISKPDIVQITARKVIRIHTPSGQSVKLSIPQAVRLSLNLEYPRFVLLLAANMMIQEINKKAIFKREVKELTRAIHLVGSDAIQAHVKVIEIVNKYVCQVLLT